MKRLLLTFAVVALLAGLLVWAMLQSSGYLLIAVGQYSIEMSLVTAAGVLIILYLAIRLLIATKNLIVRSSKGLISSDWFYRIRRDRARTTQGFSHYLQGHWHQAQRNLLRGAKFSDAPALNYLGAAIAAHELGDKQQAGLYIQQAEAISEANGEQQSEAADIVKARLYLQDQDYNSALLILQKIHKHYPRNTDILPLLVQARTGLLDWDGLKSMLPDLKRHKVYSEQRLQQIQQQVFVALMSQPSANTTAISEHWKDVPAALKRKPALIAAYVRALDTAEGESAQLAEKLLRKSINSQWDDGLVGLYGELIGGDVTKQLQVAEGWLVEHPDNPYLLATLGKISVRNQLWGKAKEYFNRSLTAKPQADIYAQLGALHDQLGEQQQSADCHRQGLLTAIN